MSRPGSRLDIANTLSAKLETAIPDQVKRIQVKFFLHDSDLFGVRLENVIVPNATFHHLSLVCGGCELGYFVELGL